MVKITLDEATALAAINKNLSWDGWTLLFNTPNKLGWARTDGGFNRETGEWYVEKKFPVQDDGMYHIPKSVYNGLQH